MNLFKFSPIRVKEGEIGKSYSIVKYSSFFFSPSTSKKEANMEAYDKAEELGRKRLCKKYYKVCKTSILGAVSKIGSFLGSAINNFD